MVNPKNKKKTTKSKMNSKDFMEKLKHFVRNKGVEYLKNENITSVGIGYKETDGKPTDEISIQFSVEEKVEPEILGAIDTVLIPESFTIDGIVVPTDVVQREFKPDFELVAETAPNRRKIRLDPIEPGISVANNKVSAGTIGCIVFDQKTGEPYILSNWHVLHGNDGKIDDDISQPGPFDDNRIQLNGVGKLVRSHLGAAGDCAIATIKDRSFVQEIFELGTTVEQLGEPELGDKVIKSGRTTNITHGKVNRIHTIAKINYGGTVGDQLVGGFEIVPDENNLPFDGEISKGGDSGACWIFKSANGKTTKIMAGLHFAGEGASNPNEHAIACYPRSVFEKLEITLTKPKPEDVEEFQGFGYNPNFLGEFVDVPDLSASTGKDAFTLENSKVIKYTHFSLAQSKSRGFAIWVGWNIDGGDIKRLSRRGIKFKLDPRIPNKYQNGDELYKNNPIDRGHIARRADLLWADIDEAKKANIDSFFFTNISPQLDKFNQSSQGGMWGKLENAVFDEADVDNLRVSVFGGPVFQNDDVVYRGVKIPREFYKVVVYLEAGELKVKAFILTQNLDQFELFDLEEFQVFQAALTEIEQRCGFTFPDNLNSADDFGDQIETLLVAKVERKPVETAEDIIW